MSSKPDYGSGASSFTILVIESTSIVELGFIWCSSPVVLFIGVVSINLYTIVFISVSGGTMELIGVYRVLPKMRLTIPKEVAERMNLKKGDKLIVYYDEENQRMVIEKWRKK